MPLDPTKLQQVLDRGDQLTKRFDALTARRAKAVSDKAQRKADRARRDAEQLTSEKAEAIASPTPEQFLLNNPDILEQPRICQTLGIIPIWNWDMSVKKRDKVA